MEHLCWLFKCTPNDLLEWIPDKESDNTQTHPLASLKRITNLGNFFKGLTYEQLKEIAKDK